MMNDDRDNEIEFTPLSSRAMQMMEQLHEDARRRQRREDLQEWLWLIGFWVLLAVFVTCLLLGME